LKIEQKPAGGKKTLQYGRKQLNKLRAKRTFAERNEGRGQNREKKKIVGKIDDRS
jgi:hypothetical protein